jgi:branched-chain amino acid transport system permease protein
LQSIAGAGIVGLIIGVLEALSAEYVNPSVGAAVEEVIAYVVLLIVLMLKPYGLFGWVRIERV